jgi:hypothetical protein
MKRVQAFRDNVSFLPQELQAVADSYFA